MGAPRVPGAGGMARPEGNTVTIPRPLWLVLMKGYALAVIRRRPAQRELYRRSLPSWWASLFSRARRG